MTNVILIAAISENNVIGKNGNLPWKIKDDMSLFSSLTKGHTVIMGRKNYESIGRPLPDRTNIVLSRQKDYISSTFITVNDFEKAIEFSRGAAFVIGGADIYKLGIEKATHFFRTTVHAKVDGDVFFPKYDRDEWELCYSAKYPKNDRNEHPFTFEVLRRKQHTLVQPE